jgi:3-phenylpropionate/trans-cinnamate dioxygenase ferredoxin subunit
MAEAKVTVLPNGPYIVEGEVPLEDGTGGRIEGAKEKYALCRCGASEKKPFCDGTHAKVGFKG